MNAQNEEISREVKIHFALDSYDLNSDSINNTTNLNRAYELIDSLNRDSLCAITKIKINSYSSPEAGYHYNQILTMRRTHSIYTQLIEKELVPENIIEPKHSGIDWEQLHQLVYESDMQYRDEVLYILENEPEETYGRVKPSDRWLTLLQSRNKRLMDLRGGRPYRYMFTHFFPKLRHGSIVTIYTQRVMPLKLEFQTLEVAHEQLITLPKRELTMPEIKILPVEEKEDKYYSLPFALKTNLLYDMATVLNVELEIPIKEHWSIAGEWIFPWWTQDDGTPQSKRNCLQLLNANIEGKYWFGNRTERPQLTGWFASIYAGGGLYDFEYNAKGYQGEFFIAAGIGVGYAHTINRSGSLRMEYSTGVGYLKTSYRYYESIYDIDSQWHAIRQLSGNYTWFGPTRARISLVWFISPIWKGGALW